MKTNEKLKIFAKKKFGNLKNLADALGVSAPSLSQYISGKYLPGNSLQKRLRDLGCDINWLMSEDDEPMPETNNSGNYGNNSDNKTTIDNTNRALREAYGKRLEYWINSRYPSIQEAAKEIGISVDLLRQYLNGRKNATELSERLIELRFDMQWIQDGVRTKIMGGAITFKGYWYPILNSVRAGEPDFLYKESNIVGYLTVDYKKEQNCYMLLVEGDSMAGGTLPIYDGDYVLVDMDIPPVQGELVVCVVAGRQMLKQYLCAENNMVTFRSYNEDRVAFPDLVYPQESVELMHRVVRIIRKPIVV